MGSERWQQLKDVVGAVLEQERQDWPTCLVEKCGHDVDLFLQASSLLATSTTVGDFIEKPAWRIFGRPSAVRQPEESGTITL